MKLPWAKRAWTAGVLPPPRAPASTFEMGEEAQARLDAVVDPGQSPRLHRYAQGLARLAYALFGRADRDRAPARKPAAPGAPDERYLHLEDGRFTFREYGGELGGIFCYVSGAPWRDFGRGAVHDLFAFALGAREVVLAQVARVLDDHGGAVIVEEHQGRFVAAFLDFEDEDKSPTGWGSTAMEAINSLLKGVLP